MPDIVLKDRNGLETTYSGVTTLAVDDTDGNEQVFYSEEALTNYYTKNQTYSKEEVYSKKETYSKDEVYSTKQTYNATQIDNMIDTAIVGSQSDMAVMDEGDSRFVKNCTHFDSRENTIEYIVGADDPDSVAWGGVIWTKISDKPLVSNTYLDLSGDTLDLDSLWKDTIVSISTTDGTVYSLTGYGLATVILKSLTNLPVGHIPLGWAYRVSYHENADQPLLDDTKDFIVYVMAVREGSKVTYDDDGSLASFDAGTYIAWSNGESIGMDGATISYTFGRLQKLDNKYLDLSNYYSKEETYPQEKLYTQDEVNQLIKSEIKKAVSSILPAFTSADNGKVLGIQNGALAWITVESASTDPDPGTEETLTVEQAYEAQQSGNYLTIT